MVATTARTRTSEFCAWVLDASVAPLPDAVAYAARRSLFNVLGTAIGAAPTPAVEALLTTARTSGGTGAVVVPGRVDTVDSHWGAIIAGTAAHHDDFDDTHLATVIHPGAATLGAMLALATERCAPGARLLSAFALGCEVQLRIGVAISPSHYDRGWHITGTCGVFGAAVAAGVLMGFSAPELAHALACASTMVLGHREGFGSATKPFHAGKAAANGVLAARLAAEGVPGFADPLGDHGVLPVFADAVDGDAFVRDGRWELEDNTFKPYPCGIVAHPAIDAAVALAPRLTDPGAITGVEVRCHPLVPELMGRHQPNDGLQAKFSAPHAVAVGLLGGRAGIPEFGDARAVDPDVIRLRDLISLRPVPGCARDEATVTISLADGGRLREHVAHARGSLARPLTDDELGAKVRDLVVPVLGPGAPRRLSAAVRDLAAAPDPRALLAATRPAEGADR
ncbi:MmgE/PrpD family protein [Amycolatopsis sp. FDAARGOS 1241]|uniref:MmgE/PrpD family protein n=1 Tax=Amycolatopsis sp. FDAARGOS 1241 TaxID=2778070 RepID=UPI00194F0B18|nr:MmgE/PrpD family protein [Amycolatopsis sp. FDAARGOS 1241]QRP43514.1 MmgE/PrpD family protein [Amycolatopsis sp. FDAARGOS 1241]